MSNQTNKRIGDGFRASHEDLERERIASEAAYMRSSRAPTPTPMTQDELIKTMRKRDGERAKEVLLVLLVLVIGAAFVWVMFERARNEERRALTQPAYMDK